MHWGGLHVTLCTFAPKLSSHVAGHHGGSLKQVQQEMAEFVRRAKGGQRWRLAANAPVTWYDSRGTLGIGIPGGWSKTLRGLGEIVRKNGLLNARDPAGWHMTLGALTALTGSNGAATWFPAKGAPPCALPPELLQQLCAASWSVVIVKRAGGTAPAKDNEAVEI